MSSEDTDLYRSAILPWSGGIQSPPDSLSDANQLLCIRKKATASPGKIAASAS